jgi:hypothetical protein
MKTFLTLTDMTGVDIALHQAAAVAFGWQVAPSSFRPQTKLRKLPGSAAQGKIRTP